MKHTIHILFWKLLKREFIIIIRNLVVLHCEYPWVQCFMFYVFEHIMSRVRESHSLNLRKLCRFRESTMQNCQRHCEMTNMICKWNKYRKLLSVIEYRQWVYKCLLFYCVIFESLKTSLYFYWLCRRENWHIYIKKLIYTEDKEFDYTVILPHTTKWHLKVHLVCYCVDFNFSLILWIFMIANHSNIQI